MTAPGVPPVDANHTQASGGSLSSYFTEPVNGGYQLYLSGDYLLWRLRKQSVPSNVLAVPQGVLAVTTADLFFTQNPNTGAITPIQSPTGTLGPVTTFLPFSAQTVATLANGNTIDLGEQPGGRITAGFWFNPEQDFGIEASAFFIDKRTSDFNATSINRPDQFVINTGVAVNDILLNPATFNAPATQTILQTNPVVVIRQTTSTVFESGSTSMWGGQVNARSTCLQFGCMTVGGLAGFRYLDVSEELSVSNSIELRQPTTSNPALITPFDSAIPALITYQTHDVLQTHNHFYGGQLGVETEILCGRFFFDARNLLGVGVMHEVVNVASATVSTGVPSIPDGTVQAGGSLTGPLDNGKHSRDRICWVDEVNLKLGYDFCHWLRGYVGYDLIYIYRVARPSDQAGISTLATTVQVGNNFTNINVNQPTFHFRDTSFTAQGLNFGLELRY
jgi:hypothetical protein